MEESLDDREHTTDNDTLTQARSDQYEAARFPHIETVKKAGELVVLMFFDIVKDDDSGLYDISIVPRLSLSHALQSLNCRVQLARFDSTVEDGYLYSRGYHVVLSELERMNNSVGNYNNLRKLLDEHQAHHRGKGFDIVEDGSETLIVFPEIYQNIKEIDGAYVGSTLSTEAAYLGALEGANPAICFYSSPVAARAARDKIKAQHCLEAIGGLPLPKTLCLPYQQEGYSQESLAEQLINKDIVPPYVVKSAGGFHGTGVHLLPSLKKTSEIVNNIMAKKEGLVIQEKISNPPGLISGRQWLKFLVYGENVLAAVKITAADDLGETPIGDDGIATRSERYEATSYQKSVVLRAASAFPGEAFVCGIDMSVKEPHEIFEVNPSPGLVRFLWSSQDVLQNLAVAFKKNILIKKSAHNTGE